LLTSRAVVRILRVFAFSICWLFLTASCQRSNSPPTVSGVIETDEVHIASRYGGRVETLFAREGDMLTNGQMVATLEASELKATRAEAAALLAELQEGPRKEEIASAKSEWEAQIAELDLARAEEKRARELFGQKTISAVERDRAVTRAASLEKSVAAAKSRYELLKAGTRPERIDQARARLAQIDTQLAEMRIKSPTNSVLETLHIKVGDVLPANREVATLLLPHLWVRVYVPEPWLGLIALNEIVKVRVDSFPKRDFEGRVEQISRMAEFTPRNTQTVAERIKQVFAVKIDLSRHQADLRAGMSADALFPNVTSESPGALP
jgi:HlyD family secretion protein